MNDRSRSHPSTYLLTIGDGILKLSASLHRSARIEAETRRERGGSHPGLCVGLEQSPVEVVGDLAAVLYLSHLSTNRHKDIQQEEMHIKTI